MGRQEIDRVTDKQIVQVWWTQQKNKEGEVMNLSLVQRPKRVSASSETLYVYAPSVLMEGTVLKPKTIIKVMEVHEGSTPEETTLKVMEYEEWRHHYRDHYGNTDAQCKLWDSRFTQKYDTLTTERSKCVCEGAIEDMPTRMQEATHFVLLSDIGK